MVSFFHLNAGEFMAQMNSSVLIANTPDELAQQIVDDLVEHATYQASVSDMFEQLLHDVSDADKDNALAIALRGYVLGATRAIISCMNAVHHSVVEAPDAPPEDLNGDGLLPDDPRD